jgi:CheY-specific phosphatase CheX
MQQQEIDLQRTLEQVTAEACKELFGRYGLPVIRATDDDEEPRSPNFFLCSIIGFTGRDLRGTLVLALTEAMSGRSHPMAGTDPGAAAQRAAQRDWVGELSNQLLGRIKLDLLRRGVEIYPNLPAVLQGEHLAPLPRSNLKPLRFVLAQDAAAVWVEVETRPGFKIEAGVDQGEPPAAGDALLFE